MSRPVASAATSVSVGLLLATCALTAPAQTPSPPPPVPSATPVEARLQLAERVVPMSNVRAPQPEMATRFRPILVEDHCVDRDLPAPSATDVALTVLDRSYALPLDYVPPDLVFAAEAGFEGTSAEVMLRSIVLDDLAAMRTGWERAGHTITLDSGYRSAASQAATFNAWVARLGYAGGLLRSARPGHSEHQLGTAIDVVSPGWEGRVGDWAVESSEGAWMAEHAWEFGFIMSYPAGSQDEACFGYEPWHYRWLGREAAAAHRASGLTLRRFLERYTTAE